MSDGKIRSHKYAMLLASVSLLCGCEMITTPLDKTPELSIKQIIGQHVKACDLMPETTVVENHKNNNATTNNDIKQINTQLASVPGTEPSQATNVLNEQEQALQDFLVTYCQQNYRHPADTAKALRKLQQAYQWPEHAIQYFALLNKNLTQHRRSLAAQTFLRKKVEKTQEELEQTLSSLEQTLSSLAKTEKQLLLRELSKGDNDKKVLPDKKVGTQAKPKKDQQLSPLNNKEQ